MKGVEISLYQMGIEATIAAYICIAESTPEELLGGTLYGKIDTKGYDATPEIIMRKKIEGYDDDIIFVTEEQEPKRSDWPKFTDRNSKEILMVADPVDRSKFFEKFIRLVAVGKERLQILDILKKIKPEKIWDEEIGDKPAVITGATTALSCVVGGKILFSVIINHISQTITIVGPTGVYQMKLPISIEKVRSVDLSYIYKNGKVLNFSSAEKSCLTKKDKMTFVAFNGKSGYPENIQDSMIFINDHKGHIHQDQPGGPTRVLYLSELQNGFGPVGFVIANGEKITEWIHWLSFVKYAKNSNGNPALMAYEVSIDRPRTKGGILMSCHSAYSIFSSWGNSSLINTSMLRNINPPSHFRSTLVVAPWDNDFIQVAMAKLNYREISCCL